MADDAALSWLEGRVQRVLYASERTGYAVVVLEDTEGKAVTAVGTLATLRDQLEPGVFLALEGEFEQHRVHGQQFRCSGVLTGTPQSLEGIRIYLGSAGVPGIGPRLADRIVEAFGIHTPQIIAHEPGRLISVSGIGKKKAGAIAEAWRRDEEGRALTMTLHGLGLRGGLIRRIRQRFGEETLRVVSHQPYRLAEEVRGVGFRTADALAMRQGLAADDPARVRAAVVHVLDQATHEGHCFLPRRRVARAVAALGVPAAGVDDAVGSAEGAGHVVVEQQAAPEDDRVWSAALYSAEVEVAHDLVRRANAAASLPIRSGEVARVEGYVEMALDPSQRQAVEAALRGGVVVVTGGPGTGKTTLVKVLLRAAQERGERWLLASPTGRAARRLAEATGAEASTLHRLLEYRPGEGGFQRNFSNPLEGHGLVVDEASMIDLSLMEALLSALPASGFSLVLVGDADQLPSVGPGQILRDIVGSGQIPVARLTVIHRQGQDSGIVRAAAAINAGQVPASGERSGDRDVFLLHRDQAAEAAELLLRVVAERLPANGFDPLEQVQVLTPMRRGVLGTQQLNRALQARLNPDGQAVTRREREFRVGDRVLCVRNRYDVEVFNGDVGRVAAITGSGLVCRFYDRDVDWAWEDLGLLDLAYAMTIHKSQGSEYPAVVMALHGSHSVMLRRNLFYTGITRARRFLCVVGSRGAWRRAAATVGGDDRFTALAERLGPGG